MSSTSENEEPFEDSGSEYLPENLSESDGDEDDYLTSASDSDNDEVVNMGDFVVVADPFSVNIKRLLVVI